LRMRLMAWALSKEKQLAQNPSKCEIYSFETRQRVEVSAAESEVAEAVEVIRATSAAIKAGRFSPKPSALKCSKCAFANICDDRSR
jgi:CRISPR/Cas system-associated exonuclease Cas4 (RecB family)